MWAKQSTAATLIVGPILDSAGAEYTGAVIGDLSISKNGGTLTALAAAATLTHIANGQYTLVTTTANLDTLGRAQITCNKSTYQMPEVRLMIVPAMVFDSIVAGSDRLDVNVTHMADTSQTAGDIAALLATLAGYVDTEVAAIKAKTDNLPSDPADASDIAAAFSAVNSTLSTIAAYIDTEVAAIKAKTDNLPSDPADASDIAASFSSLASTLSTISSYIDTEVAAIKAKTDQLTFTTPNKVDSTAVLDSAAILAVADQVWDEATSGHTTAGTYGGRIVRATNSNTEVQITGSNYIAADVHEFQAGVITSGDFAANAITASALATDAVTEIQSGLATSVALAAAKTILDKVDTGLVVDGAVYQFTANMLELGPSGGGGGGSGDATLAKQEEILTQLDVIQTKTDQIGSVGAITSLLAAAVLEPGTITSFPETLTIGDSYTSQNGRSIQIPIVDTDGNPISSTGSLNFADASVTFTLQRSGETDSTRVITGTASFVDPPGTGTGAGAPYAVVEISSTETAKGLKKYKYSGILTFTWSGTGTDVMSFETDTVVFDN